MKPAYYVRADGAICMDYDLFRNADPYEICAAVRGNLRIRGTHDTTKERQITVGKFLTSVGNGSNTSDGS